MSAKDEARAEVSMDDVTSWWRTAVSDIEPGVIRLRGYPVEDLIGRVGLAEMIWLLLRGDLPDRDEARLLEMALVSSVDHGPQAPSIATARMAATCGVGLNSAVASGVNTLGDVHGGAGQQCMELLCTIADEVRAGADRAALVASALASHREEGRFVPGFGHRFHPRDPRRDPLVRGVEEFAQSRHGAGGYVAVARELETQLAAGRPRPVSMNIDGATAVIYAELGFPPALGRGLFVLSRSVGILAHAWEEQQRGGRIKGPLPPPLLADYSGPAPRRLSS